MAREVTYNEKKNFLEYIWTCACIFGEGDSDYNDFKDSVKIYYTDIDSIPMEIFTDLRDEIKDLVTRFPQDQFMSNYEKIYDQDYVDEQVSMLTE